MKNNKALRTTIQKQIDEKNIEIIVIKKGVRVLDINEIGKVQDEIKEHIKKCDTEENRLRFVLFGAKKPL